MNKILLIERNDQVILQVTSALNSDNYEIDIAESVERGYELAVRNLPDLIICSKNIITPAAGGSSDPIREHPATAATPYIYILEQDDRPAGKNISSFDYYLIKPFKQEVLRKLAEFAISRFSELKKRSEKNLNDLRGSISFSMPHEFFTPLNGIMGFSELLINDLDQLDKKEIRQMLKYIRSDAARLKRITENFLAFAQLEMISRDPDKTEVLKNSYFINPKDIITEVARRIADKNRRPEDLVLELDDAVIRMSESYLHKLAGEIIDNAFKFSVKGSPVIITLLSNDTSVLFSVSDNGIGMSPEQISSIGAYMQFDRKLHEQQGSGLGLIISKKIAELHGGQFKVESVVKESTRVNIIFEN